MLLKNLTFFRYLPSWTPDVEEIESGLEAFRFTPCSATQLQSVGWVAPRGIENGALAEFVNGQWLLQLMVEDKPVPAAIIKQQIQERCDAIEKESGRRPGKKFQAELKEEVLLDLLPKAFPRQKRVNVWICPKNHWVMMDATSANVMNVVVKTLVESLKGLAIQELQTQVSPVAAMTDWLMEGEVPEAWGVDMDCELRSDGDAIKSVLRYSGLPLDAPELQGYIEQGMQPTQLAMTWRDRVSVVLTHELKLKRIAFLDQVFESNPHEADDPFDADAAITTGELLPLVESLIAALGGEQEGLR